MDGEKICEVTVSYDFATYRDFYRFSAIKAHGKRSGMIWLFILGPILSALMLLGGIFIKSSQMIIISVIITIVILIIAISFYIAPSIAYKKSKDIAETKITLSFYEDVLKTIYSGNLQKGNSEFKYDYFLKVFEVKTAYYLLITTNQSFVIAKKYLSDEQMLVLHDFFARKFSKQFVCK